MHTITKQFDFCYGHRVWSQKLNPTYSLDSCLKCRHLHGHQGTLLISLEAEELSGGMVTDFKHLNWFKEWLDNTLDHKFIMDIKDPARGWMFPLSDVKIEYNSQCGYWTIPNEIFESEPLYVKEIYEGVIFVNFVPTSENISKWIFDIVKQTMSLLSIKVSEVTLFETPKSKSTYK